MGLFRQDALTVCERSAGLFPGRRRAPILIDELEAGLDTETQQILSELEREMIRSNGDKIIVKISHIGKGDIFTGERSF